MKKYKCKICGYIHEGEMSDDFICPLCKVDKSLFEPIEEKENKKVFDKAIKIFESNVAIKRIEEKCINCGICTKVCEEREGFVMDDFGLLCLNCGQCIQSCPTKALVVKSDKERLYEALNSNMKVVCYTSPAVRVSIGDMFGDIIGENSQGKLIGILRQLGFDYIFDTTFGADLTVMEEVNELVKRITNNGVLPMITSCCPSWVKYAENHYSELLPNLSSCKSPIGMQGVIVKKYFSEKSKIEEKNIFTVAITPCTAKKYEVNRPEITGTDLVITVLELIDIMNEKNIDYKNITDGLYDSIMGEGSGAGIIFGNTGGVMIAALRTAYFTLTGTNLAGDPDFMEISPNVKEATITINDLTINVAVINELSKAKDILEDIKNGNSKYHFIEIMNCLGGCIGGGGQPIIKGNELVNKQRRIESLKSADLNKIIKCSHDNNEIKELYNSFLGSSNKDENKKSLHTTYHNRSNDIY